VPRLRRLTEAECYARCYGWRSDESVTVLKVPVVTGRPRRTRHRTTVSGELLRALFEEKIDARAPEAA